MTKKSHCLGVVAFHEGVFTIWYEDDILVARGPAKMLRNLGTPPVVLRGSLLSYAANVLQHTLKEEAAVDKHPLASAWGDTDQVWI